MFCSERCRSEVAASHQSRPWPEIIVSGQTSHVRLTPDFVEGLNYFMEPRQRIPWSDVTRVAPLHIFRKVFMIRSSDGRRIFVPETNQTEAALQYLAPAHARVGGVSELSHLLSLAESGFFAGTMAACLMMFWVEAAWVLGAICVTLLLVVRCLAFLEAAPSGRAPLLAGSAPSIRKLLPEEGLEFRPAAVRRRTVWGLLAALGPATVVGVLGAQAVTMGLVAWWSVAIVLAATLGAVPCWFFSFRVAPPAPDGRLWFRDGRFWLQTSADEEPKPADPDLDLYAWSLDAPSDSGGRRGLE